MNLRVNVPASIWPLLLGNDTFREYLAARFTERPRSKGSAFVAELTPLEVETMVSVVSLLLRSATFHGSQRGAVELLAARLRRPPDA